MSRSIDERIVDMQFNNQQFEEGIKDSLSSLDNLKRGLDGMDGTSKGLDDANESASKLGASFDALQVIAVTALAKITSAALDFGLTAAKSLTVEPMMEGFRAYEQQIAATKAIMNATRLEVDEVESSLARLIFFADETNFSFEQMVNSVQLFTGAGIALDDAVVAMQGIGAASGLAGVQLGDMESVFSALSKSIGSGSVRIKEWDTLQRVGLGTSIEFKQILIDTALEMGTLVEYNGKYYTSLEAAKKGTEEAEVSVSDLRTALKDNWLTTEVLMEVFEEFGSFANEVFDVVHDGANDIDLASEAIEYLSDGMDHFSERGYRASQEARTFTDAIDSISGAISARWRVSWGHLIGNVDEATEVWTEVTEVLWDVFVTSGDVRNELLAGWKELGGYSALWEGLMNILEAVISVMEPIQAAFRDIFPPITAERLVQLTEKFRDFTESLILNDNTSDKLQRTFAGLFAALDLVGMAISAVFQVAGKLLGIFIPVGDGVLGLTAGLGDFIVALRDAVVDGDAFGAGLSVVGKVLDSVQNVIHIAADGVKAGIEKLRSYFSQFGGIDLGPLKIFTSSVEASFTPFTFIASVFQKAWQVIVSVFEWAAPIVIPIAEKIGEAFRKFGSAIVEVARSGDLKSLLDIINTGLLGGLLVGLNKFVNGLSDIGSGAGGIVANITNILDGVGGALAGFESRLKAEALQKIAIAIGILAASLLVLSTIDTADMAASLAAITVMFTELSAVMLVLSKGMGQIKLGGVAIQMIAISAAVLILASAMKQLAGLDWNEVAKGTVAIAALSAILVSSASVLSKSSGQLIKGSTGLIALAAAVLILTQSVKQLGQLNLDELAKGLVGLGVILVEVAGFTQLVKAEKLISTGIAMIAMGAGLAIMASAVASLGQLSLEELAKGLVGLGVVLVEFAGFTQIVNTEKLVSTGIAMIAIGAALVIMAEAVSKFGQLSLEELAKGLVGVGASLAGLAGFTQIVNPSKMVSAGVGMIAMGAALVIIAQAVTTFGSMSWEEIAKGLIVLAGALTAIAVAANAMTGALAGAAAMAIMAASINLLVPALILLGAMDLANIGIALLALVGVFVVVGAAAAILAPLTPVILGLAAAIALLGVGVLAIGAGLLAFGTGLTLLAASGTAAVGVLVVAVMAIVDLIPAVVVALAEGLISFIKVIGDGTPVIMDTLTALVKGLITIIVDLIPDVVEAVFIFVTKMLHTFLEFLPDILDTGMKLLLALMEGISANILDIVVLALEIMEKFLIGLAEGIPGVAKAGADVIIAFLRAIGEETPRIVDAGIKMIIDFVNGMADTIRNNSQDLVDAFANLADAMIEGLITGLLGGLGAAKDAITKLGEGVISGFKETLGIHSPSTEFYDMGEDTVDGYVGGVNDSSSDAEDATARMAAAALNSAYDIFQIKNGKSNIFSELGVANAEGFIDGLNSMGESIKQVMEETFTVDENVLRTAFGSDEEGFQKALADNKAFVEEMSSLIDEALTTIESRIESYTDLATDRFNRINTESEVTVAEMISNLKHNQMAIAEWADNIAKLAKRGLDEGLLEELRQAGPSSAGEVKALVAASDKELQELNTVMARGGQVATQALVTSVGEGAPLLVEPGQSMQDALAQGLASVDNVNDAMALLINQAKKTGQETLSAADFTDLGKNIPDGLAQGISSNASGVVAGVDKMADETKNATMNAFGMHSPSKVYDEYGMNLMLGLEGGITNNADKPISAIESMFSKMEVAAKSSGEKVTQAAESGLRSNDAVFGQIGTKYGTDFSNQLTNKQTAANVSGKTVTTRAEEGIKFNAEVFGKTGNKYGTDFSTELESKKSASESAGKSVGSSAEKGIKENVDEFKKAGENAGKGFVSGIESYIEEAAKIARKLAKAAKDAIDDELGIRSPSRVLRASGEYAGEGFVDGLLSMIKSSALAGEEIADAAIDGVTDAIHRIVDIVDDEIESTITITPVLDLSNIQNGSKLLEDMLKGANTVTPIEHNVNKIISQLNGNLELVDGQHSEGQTVSNTYTFEQNNYSPKALSRLEIYRQTKNQFAQLKGVAEGV